MSPSDEELLSAYLDGMLGEVDAARVEQMISADPALAVELDRLRANDKLLRAAMRAAVSDDVHADDLRRFGLAAAPAAAAPETRAANDNRRTWTWAGAAAIAASAALFLFLQPRGAEDPWQTAAFATALETTPSLQQASLPKGAILTPRLTIVAADGRFCREFEITAKDSEHNRDGLACRSASGAWQAVALAAPAGGLGDATRIEVAGGPDGSNLDAAYQRLRASDPLPADQERALIARHWAK